MFDAKDICAAVTVCSLVFGHPFELKKCDAQEACISQNEGVVARDGKKLTINTNNHDKKQLTFVDNIPVSDGAEDEIVKHKLAAYENTRKIFIVANSYYEDADYTVVDANSGSIVDVEAEPRFSPEGSRFVCLPFMDGPSPKNHDIAIWTVENGSFRQEFTHNNPPEEGNYEWSFVGWDGEKHVKLRVSRQADGQEIVREAEAILASHGWEVNVPEMK